MELRQLRYFVAVAEELNFTRAAERVGIAQPPLSQQIRALEQELGTDLFTRTKRYVKLTQAGELFLVHARRTLQCAEEGKEVVREVKGGLRGTISVAAIYSAAYSIVPKILREFRNTHPNVNVHLSEMGVAEQHKALHEGAIDVGLLRPPAIDKELEYVTLFKEPFVAVMPARHRLSRKKLVSLAELAGEPFVSLPSPLSESVGALMIEMFERSNLRLNVVQEVSEMHSLLCLIASGLGVSVVPASVNNIRLRDIAYREISDKTPLTAMCLAFSRRTTSLLVPRFVEVVRSVVADKSFSISA